MAFIEISAVGKAFGAVEVLRDIDLRIERGQFVVFVGPSGCGKSTLLRMISGLEEITTGTISIEGEVMNRIEPARRGAAMVFQSYALYPHMTAFQNVSFGLRMARQPRSLIRQKVAQAASILQLDQLLGRRPAQLSGGQKQRVAIGRAIVREPRVFLFDEPLSNLDAELRVQMRAELTELHRRLGTTMIYVTHDQVEAMTLADMMVVMNGGRIQQAGPPLLLYDDPANRFVAGFVGSPRMNFLPARLAAGPQGVTLHDIAGADGSLALALADPRPGPVELGLRPEHLTLLPDDAPAAAGQLRLRGRVVLIEELGAESFVHMVLAERTTIVVRAGRDAARAGELRLIGAEIAQVRLFAADGSRLRPDDGLR